MTYDLLLVEHTAVQDSVIVVANGNVARLCLYLESGLRCSELHKTHVCTKIAEVDFSKMPYTGLYKHFTTPHR